MHQFIFHLLKILASGRIWVHLSGSRVSELIFLGTLQHSSFHMLFGYAGKVGGILGRRFILTATQLELGAIRPCLTIHICSKLNWFGALWPQRILSGNWRCKHQLRDQQLQGFGLQRWNSSSKISQSSRNPFPPMLETAHPTINFEKPHRYFLLREPVHRFCHFSGSSHLFHYNPYFLIQFRPHLHVLPLALVTLNQVAEPASVK